MKKLCIVALLSLITITTIFSSEQSNKQQQALQNSTTPTSALNPSQLKKEAMPYHMASQYFWAIALLDFTERRFGKKPVEDFDKKVKNPYYCLDGKSFLHLRAHPIDGILVLQNGEIAPGIKEALTQSVHYHTTSIVPSNIWRSFCNAYLPDDKKYAMIAEENSSPQ